jgi:sarcosine oxidase subunit beta
VANGFSGHGFKLAPAVGALMAQAITGGQAASFGCEVDIGLFAVDRAPIPLAVKSVLA